MRVVLATVAAEPGGVWRHCQVLAAALLRDRHSVVLAVPAGALGRVRDLVPGVRTTDLAASLAEDCDVWHLHLSKTLDLAALGHLARARLHGRARRVLVTEHLPRAPASDPTLAWDPNLAPGRPKPGAHLAKTLVKRLQLRLAHRTIAVSESSKRFMVARYGAPPHRIVVVPNGVRVEGLPAGPPATPPLRVVCIGAVAWRKGYDVLLAGVGRSAGGWRVDVYGEGDQLSAMRAAAAGAGPGRVAFHGWREDAARSLREAHVLCLPSRSEAMPYVVLEAMAAARAVVASAVDGVTELVDDGVSGLLVEPGDPEALARALDRLAGDPDEAARMGRAGWSRAARMFTEDRMVTETFALYRRL